MDLSPSGITDLLCKPTEISEWSSYIFQPSVLYMGRTPVYSAHVFFCYHELCRRHFYIKIPGKEGEDPGCDSDRKSASFRIFQVF